MLTISPAQESDAPVIHALQQRAFAEEGRLSGTDQIPPLMETAAEILQLIRAHTVVVAKDADELVGSARGIRHGTLCTVRGVIVEPAKQGQGIGALLLAAIEQLHPDVSRFALTTNTLVPGNVRFYERLGYTVDALTPYTGTIVLAQMSKRGATRDA